MTRQELLNSPDYWQEMAENECWREGIDCKIHLIDSNNQWHKVEDGLPPVGERGSGNFSIETLFTDGEYMFVGFYSFKSKTWVDREYCFPSRITHWAKLPELPKKEEE